MVAEEVETTPIPSQHQTGITTTLYNNQSEYPTEDYLNRGLITKDLHKKPH